MNQKILIALGSLIVGLGALPLNAQWIVVSSFENVKDHAFNEPVRAWKEFIEAEMPEHPSWTVLTSDQGEAVIVKEIESLDALEEEHQKDKEAAGKMFAAMEKEKAGTTKEMVNLWRISHSASERSIWKLRKDLSTLPEEEAMDADPPRFRRMTSYVLAPAGGSRVEAWLKALHEMQDASGRKQVRLVFESYLGGDGHTIMVSEPAESAAAYYAAREEQRKQFESLDEDVKSEFLEALKEFRESDAVRSVKKRNVRYRKSLSHRAKSE